MHASWAWNAVLALGALAVHGACTDNPSRSTDNVLVLVLDDVGVERVGAYGLRCGQDFAADLTPNLDRAAARGVRFTNAWASPVCSPARALALTGRHAFRTGIGDVVSRFETGPGLALEEDLLPEILPGYYRTAAVGKWHLGSLAQGNLHPLESGFELFRGSAFNVLVGENHFEWFKVIDGSAPTLVTKYSATDTTDETLRAIDEFGPDPWFIWASYNLAHKPLHAPPAHLHDQDLSGDPEATPVAHFDAMTQALDAEIGRLLAGIPHETLQRTTVVIFSDNGTYPDASTCPFGRVRAKGRVFEGGVRVPFIVLGARVAESSRGASCDALISIADLHASVAELCGAYSAAEDSVSFLPYLDDPGRPSLRSTVYTERFSPNGLPQGTVYHRYSRAIRDARYKLIRAGVGHEDTYRYFYDLESDPFESENLLVDWVSRGEHFVEPSYLGEEELAHFLELKEAMERLIEPSPGPASSDGQHGGQEGGQEREHGHEPSSEEGLVPVAFRWVPPAPVPVPWVLPETALGSRR